VEDARGVLTAEAPSEVGTELYIRCRVTAHGTDALDVVSFVFRVDGSVVRELRLPIGIGAPLAIGEYWTPSTPGAHEIVCEVNPDRKVQETVYADNVRSRTVEVRPKGSVTAATPPKAARPAPPAIPSPPAAAPTPAFPPAVPTTPSPAPKAAAPPPSSAPPPAAPVPAPSPTPGPSAALPPRAAPSAAAKPDLAIVGVKTVADPGCARKEPTVTVHVTVKNVGDAVFVSPRNSALLEATVKIIGVATLAGRKYVPQLPPGASAELDVVARSRGSVAAAGGLRYSVVVIVNGDGQAEEATLDNNGEYVKAAAFPPC
jgi:hypothetical protein